MTTTYTLTDDWQQIGQGAITVDMEEGRNAWAYSGLVAPLSNNNCIIISPQRPQHKYSGPLKTFARVAENSQGVRTRVTVTEEEEDRDKFLEVGETITLPLNTVGNGFMQAGDNVAHAHFTWDTTGYPEISSSSDNVSNTDTPNKICIFKEDNVVTIKNNLSQSILVSRHIKYR